MDASLHDIIDQMATSTTGSEFRDEIASFLHESLDAAQSFSDWFARILARLFRDTPLVLFSPHIPEARALAAPVLEWEIEHPLAPTNLLNAAGARLVTLGYKQQVVKEDTECNFFLEVDQRRCKVRYKDSRYIVPDARLSFSVDEMLSLLEAAPERFSSNVALRCLEQQHLFSPVAYVAGPSEVAYWGQLKPLFDCADLDMPVVYPRARCALTNLKLNALLSRFGFTLDDMELPHVELVERALESIVDDPRLAIVEKRRHDVSAALGALCDELEGVDKTFSEMARRVETRTYWGLDRLQNAIVRSDKEQVDAVTNQVTRLCNELYPFRKPQERVVNIFSYLFEYGWDLIPRIVQEIDVEEFALKEIEL